MEGIRDALGGTWAAEGGAGSSFVSKGLLIAASFVKSSCGEIVVGDRLGRAAMVRNRMLRDGGSLLWVAPPLRWPDLDHKKRRQDCQRRLICDLKTLWIHAEDLKVADACFWNRKGLRGRLALLDKSGRS